MGPTDQNASPQAGDTPPRPSLNGYPSFDVLADFIPQFVWMCTPDGLNVYFNQRWVDYTGLTLEESYGRGWNTPFHPEDKQDAWNAWNRSTETGEPYFVESRLRAADGSYRWFLMRGEPLKDATRGVVHWFGSCTDIHDLKLAQEALRQSETRERERAAELEAIMDAVPVATFIAHDANCLRIVGNRMTYELLGLPLGTNLSKTASEAEIPTTFHVSIDGHQLPPAELPIQKAASTGNAIRNYEFEIALQDGERRCLLGDSVPLLGADGSPRGAVGAFLDITERKRHEERLRQTQKLESVGLLAGGIAHDFNNLLTSVMGNASLLLEDISSEQGNLVKGIIASAERAAHLTRQLLAYSGKGQFVIRDLDVSQAVNEIADLVQFSIPKSVSLNLNLERRLPSVAMDPGQLQQILMNLIINGGEAIGEGKPGRITVVTTLTQLESPTMDAIGQEIAPGRYVCIEVSDTGGGIAPEMQAKIFDPFFTTKFTGRGLGLAAVAGILRSQRGGITLQSTPGSGSTFRVCLPIGTHRVEETADAAVAAGQATILVVDDEAAVRDFIGSVLRRKGYRVLSAADGQEALRICGDASGSVDAAVVDIIMPNMAANDLLPALKSIVPRIRVLLTSGYSESEARRLCVVHPDASFIQKPYTAQHLAKAVSDLLS